MNIIPYDHKIDINLQSFQTFVATFDSIPEFYPTKDNGEIDPIASLRLITETQAAVNKSLLDLIESIMEHTYPRAKDNQR